MYLKPAKRSLWLAKVLVPYDIVVNGLASGPTETPMLKTEKIIITNDRIPLGRFVMPEEFANLAFILVSEMGRPNIQNYGSKRFIR